ncbi:MAG TPA: hypothetical protein VFW22_16370 [Pseudolabrys sp.]|nr:hypothetical protein [Pseudolabrys sp.]
MSSQPPEYLAALDRLLELARGDTGQCRRVANFLLAWHNGGELGGFDLADLFCVDRAIARDMAIWFAYLAQQPTAIYADAVGRDAEMRHIVTLWRDVD